MPPETMHQNPAENKVSIMSQIRLAIRADHDLAEATPLAKAIANATVTKEQYAKLLVQLHLIHQSLEQSLATQEHLKAFANPTHFRLETLERDLEHFGVEPKETPLPATIEFCEKVSQWEKNEAILGALYVLEGSRMGSRVLVSKLAKAFNCAPEPGNGLDYHLIGQDHFIKTFMQFKAKVDSIVRDPKTQIQLRDAARETMAIMAQLYSEVI